MQAEYGYVENPSDQSMNVLLYLEQLADVQQVDRQGQRSKLDPCQHSQAMKSFELLVVSLQIKFEEYESNNDSNLTQKSEHRVAILKHELQQQELGHL